MDDFFRIAFVLAVLVSAVGLSVLILRGLDRLTIGPSPTPEELTAREAEYQVRLLRPRFDELESHYGRPVPPGLRRLYDRPDLLTRQGVAFGDRSDGTDDRVERFLPADLKTVEQVCFGIPDDSFPFAEDGFGNYYYVRLDSADGRSPVYLLDHDGGESSLIADSIDEWLSRELCDG